MANAPERPDDLREGGEAANDTVPRWREDFPVRWDDDHYMTRRELAKFLTLGSGLLAGTNLLVALIGLSQQPPTPLERRIAAADDALPGTSLLFRYQLQNL